MKRLLKKLKPVERGLKKIVLRLLSPMLKCRESGPYTGTNHQWEKILLFRHEKIGDVVITLSLVDALKRGLPGCKVSFLASPDNVMVVREDPRFDKVFLFNKSLWKDLRMIMAARREKFDCVIDLITRDSATAMFLTRFCGPKAFKIGVGKVIYREFYNYQAPHPQNDPDKHILDFHLDLLEILGARIAEDLHYAPLYINDKAEEKAREFYRSLDIDDRLTIGVNISAGTPTRDWGAANFLELVDAMVKRVSVAHLIIITAPREYHLGLRIKDSFDDRVHIIPGPLDLMTVAAVIRKLDMLVSPDTSLVHVARAFDVPVVGLYRRFLGEYKFWRPYGQKAGLVLSGNEEDVFDITVEQVMDEIKKVIDEFDLMSKTPGLMAAKRVGK